MKRSLVTVMAMSCVLMVATITGCGNKETVTPSTSTTTAAETEAAETTATETKTTETTVAEITAAVEEKVEANDYLSWTGEEWAAASDEEKAAVTKYFLIESAKITAKVVGQEYSEEMEAAFTDEMVNASVINLEAAFAADSSMTLQAIMDATVQAAEMIGEKLATQPVE